MIMYRNVHINKQVMGSSNRKKGTNAAIAAGIVLVLLLCSLACSDVLDLQLCTFELCPGRHVRIFPWCAMSHKSGWR